MTKKEANSGKKFRHFVERKQKTEGNGDVELRELPLYTEMRATRSENINHLLHFDRAK